MASRCPFLLKKVELDEMKLLSVMAGLGVYHALRRIYSEDCFAIKWPNDVLAGEKKICGILCESKYDGQVADVVCGIGINVAQQQDFFDENGLPFATSLQLAAGKQVRQEIIAAGVLGEIEKTLGMYRDGKWPEILAQYRKSCINLGREVVVTQGDQAIEGVAEDLDEDGALVVRADGKLHHIHAGEAHVRGLYGYV